MDFGQKTYPGYGKLTSQSICARPCCEVVLAERITLLIQGSMAAAAAKAAGPARYCPPWHRHTCLGVYVAILDTASVGQVTILDTASFGVR